MLAFKCREGTVDSIASTGIHWRRMKLEKSTEVSILNYNCFFSFTSSFETSKIDLMWCRNGNVENNGKHT